MDDLKLDERKTHWRFWLSLVAGILTAILTFFVIVLINPVMPFSAWICLFFGYLGYRLIRGLTTPAKFCPKCRAILPKDAMACPQCGKPLPMVLE